MSRLRLSLSSCCALSAFGAQACVVVDGDDDYDSRLPSTYVPADFTIVQAPIDPGERLQVESGVGAGVFVEYESGGIWRVLVACDTVLSDAVCEWDIVASVPRTSTLEHLGDEELEADDLVLQVEDDPASLRLWTFTDVDFDGYVFQAGSGEPVRFDVLLDGAPAPEFVNWVSGGGVLSGGLSNPFELVPTSP